MKTTLRNVVLLFTGALGASACTSILGGFDFDGKGTGGTGGSSSTSSSTSSGTGGASSSSTSSGGGSGGATSSSSSSSGTVCTETCTKPEDCTTALGTACQAHSCDMGCCGVVNLPVGTKLPATLQMAGDCLLQVCDTNGNVTKTADVNDVPPSANACNTGSCNGSNPAQLPVAGACSFSGGTVCGSPGGAAAGTCVACNGPADCAPTGTNCVDVHCTGNACQNLPASTGTGCSDNGGKVCDGAGSCVECNAVSDCPVSPTACVTPSCSAVHTCKANNAVAGAACTDLGGKVCDGAGSCVGCLTSAQCTAPQVCDTVAKKCIPPGCTNNVKDTAETDVDCGGPTCGPCAPGKACFVQTDCTPGYCNGGICKAPTCTDAVLDGNETDTDCGGSCTTKCADGKHCAAAGDCLNNNCAGGFCVSCMDGAQNGTETDTDCGGSCTTKCADTRKCVVNSDCLNNNCFGGKCVSCMDGVKDGTETDKDCGGGGCAKCGLGKTCNMGSDCTTGACGGGLCVPSCTDGVKDGSETDVDCGGSCGTKCAFGKGCATSADCASGYCNGTTCDAQTVATVTGNGASGIATDATNVYWVTYAGTAGVVAKAPLGGGSPIVLANNVQSSFAIAIDTVYAYWTTNISSGAVWRGPLNSPLMGTIVQSGQNLPRDVAVGGGFMFWTTGSSAQLWRSLPSGGTVTMLASGVGRFIALDSTPSYVYTGDSTATQSTVQRVPISGTAPIPVCTAPQGLFGIAVDATSVYFGVSGALMKCPVAGGAAVTVASAGAPQKIAVDGTSVYWMDAITNAIAKAPIGGGTATTLATFPNLTAAIAIDPSWVYFSLGDGSIRRVHK